MDLTTARPEALAEAQDDLIVALDVPTIGGAKEIIDELDGVVHRHKVGLELLTAAGVCQTVHALQTEGGELWTDLKLCDTPNTIAGTMRTLAKLGVWGVTVMAGAGPDSLKAALDNADRVNVIGVTVITSISKEDCEKIHGREPEAATLKLCELLVTSGVKYVVCSPLEVAAVMKRGFGLIPICPNVKLAGQTTSGQVRGDTPYATIMAQNGGGHIVVGRAITDVKANGCSRREAARRVLVNMLPAYDR